MSLCIFLFDFLGFLCRAICFFYDFNGGKVTLAGKFLCLAQSRKISILSPVKASRTQNVWLQIFIPSSIKKKAIIFHKKDLLTTMFHAIPYEHWFESIWENLGEGYFMRSCIKLKKLIRRILQQLWPTENAPVSIRLTRFLKTP